MTSFGQRSREVYSLSRWVDGDVMVRSEVSRAAEFCLAFLFVCLFCWREDSFVPAEFPPENVWCALEYTDLETCVEGGGGAWMSRRRSTEESCRRR